jgi:hypothetical protein
MMKIFLLVILGFNVLLGGGHESQMSANAQEELNAVLIQERIAKTSPEGLEVIEKVKRMMPEIQKNLSAKSLGEAVEDCTSGCGKFLIYPIGWEALRSDGPRWMVSFYFQDKEQKYLKATWEYNDERKALIPAEFTNATKFWVRRTKNYRP